MAERLTTQVAWGTLCALDLVGQVSTAFQQQLTFIAHQGISSITDTNLLTNAILAVGLDL